MEMFGRVWITSALVVVASGPAVSSPAGPSDETGRLLTNARFTPQQSQAALALVERATGGGLPAPALVNRIREGIARNAAPEVILAVTQDRLSDLERADAVVHSCAQQGIAIRDRDHSIEKIADSFTQGVKPADVTSLIPSAKKGTNGLETVAAGAEVMGRLDRRGFPPSDTREIVAAAVGAGWPSSRMDKLVDLRVEAAARHLSPKEAHDVLVAGILGKKEDASLQKDMRQAETEHEHAQNQAQHEGTQHEGTSHQGQQHDGGQSGKGAEGHGGKSSGGGHQGKQGGNGGHSGGGGGGGGAHGHEHGGGHASPGRH
jgi:hypothetical protein